MRPFSLQFHKKNRVMALQGRRFWDDDQFPAGLGVVHRAPHIRITGLRQSNFFRHGWYRRYVKPKTPSRHTTGSRLIQIEPGLFKTRQFELIDRIANPI